MKFFLPVYALCAITLIAWVVSVSPPGAYPEGLVIDVPDGSSISSVATLLSEHHALAFPFVFKGAAHFFGGVQAGAYNLGSSTDAVRLAARFARGDTGLTPLSVTIPEGSTVREVSQITGVAIADSEEGYLFPDTYLFYPKAPARVVVSRMRERYEEMVEPLRPRILASGHSEQEIVTMASILEKEARQYETMRVASGILWNRIKIGMPLQVDAVFGYIYGTPTFHPTFSDLEIDSPYNTYKYRGLPPGPIGNPGLNAIKAAIDPEPSPYLYYLTGKDGTMHYAKTFDEHVANRRFLR